MNSELYDYLGDPYRPTSPWTVPLLSDAVEGGLVPRDVETVVTLGTSSGKDGDPPVRSESP